MSEPMLDPHESLKLAETDPCGASVAFIRFCRQSHVNWAEFLRCNPEYSTRDVGDAHHHEADVQMYDVVLTMLGRADAHAPDSGAICTGGRTRHEWYQSGLFAYCRQCGARTGGGKRDLPAPPPTPDIGAPGETALRERVSNERLGQLIDVYEGWSSYSDGNTSFDTMQALQDLRDRRATVPGTRTAADAPL